LTLQYDEPLSSVSVNFNLRRHIKDNEKESGALDAKNNRHSGSTGVGPPADVDLTEVNERLDKAGGY